MNARLFNRTRSCHEVGVCQRTVPQCHRVCHMAGADQGEPPIGYEAARPCNIRPLRHPAPATRTAPDTRQHQSEEAADQPEESWAVVNRLCAGGLCAAAAVVALLVLIGVSLATPDSLLHRLAGTALRLAS